jgi:hypothetical protein
VYRANGRVGEGIRRSAAEIAVVRESLGSARKLPCLGDPAFLGRHERRDGKGHDAREGDGGLAPYCLPERLRRSGLSGKEQAEAERGLRQRVPARHGVGF